MGGVHDPGSRVLASISIIPHHPLLPVWAQRGPHRSACGPHDHNTTHRAHAALHLLCGLLHPPAEPADSHDERHPLEGGAGARRALEDSGIRRSPEEDTGRWLLRSVRALITRPLLLGCCHNVDVGEEAASLPLASTGSVRPRVRSEGTLVSQVRHWLKNRWWKTWVICSGYLHVCRGLPGFINKSFWKSNFSVKALVLAEAAKYIFPCLLSGSRTEMTRCSRRCGVTSKLSPKKRKPRRKQPRWRASSQHSLSADSKPEMTFPTGSHW